MDLRCMSHSSQLIQLDSEDVMKFVSTCPTIDLLAYLYETEMPYEKTPTLSHRNFTNQQLLVYCSVPDSNKRYKLGIFAKDLSDLSRRPPCCYTFQCIQHNS